MKTYEHVYQLLKKSDTFITGEYLAEQLGLSRTAIWKAIKKLEKNGIIIEAVKNKGYRICSGDLLLPEKIADALQIAVSMNDNSLSTQLDAKKGIETASQTPHLYLATQQGKAKGRFERPFFTAEQEQGGIYMSLHFKPQLSFNQTKPYTLMVAASIVKAISRLTGIETEIKWVNDIYLDGKKIGGILTEAMTSVETGAITDVIIGVGFNFSIKDFPESLTAKATSLFSTEQPTISRNQLITEIWKLFFTIPEKDLLKVYKEKSLVLDKTITFMENGQTYKGTAYEITDRGELLVRLDNGQKKTLTSGEISLSSW
ncbi:bifunctional biotin--[acetyl-CoA-carboxylase] ligase/biotin operon repressor BirA [Streptococcus pantholopis]|uniref:Bifunctional ligase/repressor BirA n=1 Tax=Streptococcus pantholopis TaxID=1811193 RepID=A0A172Q854_9STRE|nr:bifunctional biotin--[acetyl-CoA-carboxylase] ligase/biotin operon repressor BirA [Streptococcus pantholopis]AND79636.1 bifunctional biotin--[acetyl-CoA-carboxylase] synthetase/biotin operon repressor [Streptococcus pantholopis]